MTPLMIIRRIGILKRYFSFLDHLSLNHLSMKENSGMKYYRGGEIKIIYITYTQTVLSEVYACECRHLRLSNAVNAMLTCLPVFLEQIYMLCC